MTLLMISSRILFTGENEKVKVKSLSRVWLFATLWNVASQAPLSMWFPRQECWWVHLLKAALSALYAEVSLSWQEKPVWDIPGKFPWAPNHKYQSTKARNIGFKWGQFYSIIYIPESSPTSELRTVILANDKLYAFRNIH